MRREREQLQPSWPNQARAVSLQRAAKVDTRPGQTAGLPHAGTSSVQGARCGGNLAGRHRRRHHPPQPSALGLPARRSSRTPRTPPLAGTPPRSRAVWGLHWCPTPGPVLSSLREPPRWPGHPPRLCRRRLQSTAPWGRVQRRPPRTAPPKGQRLLGACCHRVALGLWSWGRPRIPRWARSQVSGRSWGGPQHIAAGGMQSEWRCNPAHRGTAGSSSSDLGAPFLGGGGGRDGRLVSESWLAWCMLHGAHAIQRLPCIMLQIKKYDNQ